MPYITASIIVQLLRVVIPHFETLYKEGQAGQSKLTQYTRYLTIALGVLQSTTLITVARSGALFASNTRRRRVLASSSPTTPGTRIMLMVITHDRRHRPHHVDGRAHHRARHRQRHVAPDLHLDRRARSPPRCGRSSSRKGFEIFLLVLAVGIVVMALVVFVEQSQRRIPVQYAKRMVGRRTYGGNNTYIPIKVNMAGVVPVIFASSLLYLPALIAQFNQPQAGETPAGWVTWIHELPDQGRPPALHAVVLPAHRRLHLLLRRDHLQP